MVEPQRPVHSNWRGARLLLKVVVFSACAVACSLPSTRNMAASPDTICVSVNENRIGHILTSKAIGIVRMTEGVALDSEITEYLSAVERLIGEINKGAGADAEQGYDFILIPYSLGMASRAGRGLAAGVICPHDAKTNCRNINYWVDQRVAIGEVARAVVSSTVLDLPAFPECSYATNQ